MATGTVDAARAFFDADNLTEVQATAQRLRDACELPAAVRGLAVFAAVREATAHHHGVRQLFTCLEAKIASDAVFQTQVPLPPSMLVSRARAPSAEMP